MSTISRMQLGNNAKRGMLQDEISPMNFLNTPIRTRNQYKIESRAGSSMVSPFPQKRTKISTAGAAAIAADLKGNGAMVGVMAQF